MNRKKLLILQSIIIFGGVAFAWFTVANDFLRFYSNTRAINPIFTPCFYGAIGFLIAYIYSLYIYFAKETTSKKHQRYLMIFLLCGTIFGWSNFILELCRFYFISGSKTSCSGLVVSSPFVTPCFYGSVIYLLSLISSVFAWRKK